MFNFSSFYNPDNFDFAGGITASGGGGGGGGASSSDGFAFGSGSGSSDDVVTSDATVEGNGTAFGFGSSTSNGVTETSSSAAGDFGSDFHQFELPAFDFSSFELF